MVSISRIDVARGAREAGDAHAQGHPASAESSREQWPASRRHGHDPGRVPVRGKWLDDE